MGMIKYISSQFSNPRGIGGKISTYFMNQLNKKQYQSIITLFDKIKPKKVLDIGFGNGYLLKKLAKKSTANFSGIEISEDMIKQAIKRNKAMYDKGKMALQQGDVIEMAFAEGFFDFIYTVNTVYFWSDLPKGYSEIHRVLKKGGCFANTFYTKDWLDKLQYTKYGFNKYTPEELVAEVSKIGFEKVELIEIQKDCAYCLVVQN